METVVKIYKERGQMDYIGESISQLEHALQAGCLAWRYVSTCPEVPFQREAFVVAALLHDIGHLLTVEDFSEDPSIVLFRGDLLDDNERSLGRQGHEHLGFHFLERLSFISPIPELVRSHVNAKRYRVSVMPSYFDLLSEASKKTLELQGGRMSLEEIERFERDPLYLWKLRIREWDDQAKVPGLSYKKGRDIREERGEGDYYDLEAFIPLIEECIRKD